MFLNWASIVAFCVFSFFYYGLALLNYFFTNALFLCAFYLIYALLTFSCIRIDVVDENKKLQYLYGAIAVLVSFVSDDYFIKMIGLALLVYVIIRIKRLKWAYILFSLFLVISTLVPLAISSFIVPTVKDIYCDVSPSGTKTLTRNVADIGAAGYSLSYYVTENHTFLSRKYLVASRGKMSFAKENCFIDENTLSIQGIVYDIEGKYVIFKQPVTNNIIHRNKRKPIFFFF